MNPSEANPRHAPSTYFSTKVLPLLLLASMVACGSGGVDQPAASTGSSQSYGSALNADDLGNITLGYAYNDGCNRQYSIRFRSTRTGKLNSIRPFFIWDYSRIGYHAGNGGTIQIQVQPDDGSPNHTPTGAVLATMNVVHPVNDAVGFYPLLTFSSPADLTSGRIYHLVFTNVDADPKANWVSLDCAWMWYAATPTQPTVPDTDLAILERCPSGSWSLYRRGTASATPCLNLHFADGSIQGQGYIEFYSQNPKPISGSQGVREVFKVSGFDRVVTSASIRVRYLSGPSPLTIRLERADGTLVEQGTVPQVQVTPGINGSSWAKVTFQTPRTLQVGQTYHLVMSAPVGTVFQTQGIRKGTDKGFSPSTLFADGVAQFNDGSGWTGWDSWGQFNRQDVDLQFYFETK